MNYFKKKVKIVGINISLKKHWIIVQQELSFLRRNNDERGM